MWIFNRSGARPCGRFGVKAASSRYVVPGSVVAYVVTWAYVSGRTAWCWRLLESLFPLRSFGVPYDQLRQVPVYDVRSTKRKIISALAASEEVFAGPVGPITNWHQAWSAWKDLYCINLDRGGRQIALDGVYASGRSAD